MQSERLLKEEQAAKMQELEDAERKWAAAKSASDARLAPALREIADLRKQLAAPPAYVPPSTSSERVLRWKALGYDVRVTR